MARDAKGHKPQKDETEEAKAILDDPSTEWVEWEEAKDGIRRFREREGIEDDPRVAETPV